MCLRIQKYNWIEDKIFSTAPLAIYKLEKCYDWIKQVDSAEQ